MTMTRLSHLCIALLVATLLLAACGGQPAAEAPEPTQGPVAEAREGETIAPTSEEVTPSDCEDGFRLYDHEALADDPVCIPVDPQRIAVFDPNMTSILIQQGITPVTHFGIWIASFKDSHPEQADYIDGVMADSTDVGAPGNINLEALLAAKPDIVLTASHYIEGVDEEVRQIAPVVGFDYQSGSAADWEMIISVFGDAINISNEIDALIGDVNKRIDVLRTTIDDPENTTVSLLAYYGVDEPQILLSNWPASRIMRDVGLGRPEPQDVTDAEAIERYGNPYSVPISMEELPMQDADFILTMVFNSDDAMDQAIKESVAAVESGPIWQSLDAVQNGNAYTVGGHWVLGGIYDIHKTIDDLFEIVAGVDPAEVSPNPFLSDATGTN